MKKTLFYGAIILVILILLFIVFPKHQKQQGTEKTTIKIGYNVQGLNYGPLMLALEKNFFEKNGLNVEMISLKSGKEVRQAIASGHLNIGLASASNFFTVIAAGAPIKIIAPVSTTNVSLAVRPDNQIQTFKDLKGKKIAGGKGGQSEFVLRRALKKEGIDISEVELIFIDSEYQGVALMEKKTIDAIPSSRYRQENFQKLGAVNHKEWMEKGYGDESWPNTVIGINTTYLDNNAELVQKVINVFIDSHKLLMEEPRESARLIAQHINIGTDGVSEYTEEEVIKIWNEGLKYTLWYDPTILVEMSYLLFESGMIEKELTLEDIFDTRFQDILKKAHETIYL